MVIFIPDGAFRYGDVTFEYRRCRVTRKPDRQIQVSVVSKIRNLRNRQLGEIQCVRFHGNIEPAARQIQLERNQGPFEIRFTIEFDLLVIFKVQQYR